MDVLMPQLGETVAEGKILAWFKNVGDDVQEGDNIFEIETDKVTMEVQAITSGKLSEIRVQAGEVVKVGSVVAVIGGAGSAAAPTSASAPASAPVAAPAPAPAVVASAPVSQPAPKAAQPVASGPMDPFNEVRTPVGNFGKSEGPNDVRVTPLARRLIAQNNLDVARIANDVKSRGENRVMERHVRAALASGGAAASVASAPAAASAAPSRVAIPALPSDGDVITLNAVRRKTGERLAENWRTIPHVFQGIDVDFGSIDKVRAKHKGAFKAQNGISLTYLPFIARATCIALKEFPQVNARFDGEKLTLSRDVNLGIAVDMDHKGLVVPVIANADELTVTGLAKAIGRAAQKARAGKLTPAEMQGGTYTITNNGAFGTMFTAPIINAPQVAILSTDAIRKRPTVVETSAGDFIAIRPVGMVAQSFDHRAFDGAYSAAFLSRLKHILETRDWATEFA